MARTKATSCSPSVSAIEYPRPGASTRLGERQRRRSIVRKARGPAADDHRQHRHGARSGSGFTDADLVPRGGDGAPHPHGAKVPNHKLVRFEQTALWIHRTRHASSEIRKVGMLARAR
jgi:hypothetical protein